MELEIDRILGLPAHPLFAHAPVVLVPLVAVGAVVCALSRRWRARIGWLVVAGALVAVVSVQLAIGSGEALEESVEESELVDDHTAVGDTVLPLAGGLFVAVTALVSLDAHARRRRAVDAASPETSGVRTARTVLAVSTIALAGIATAWTVRAGHSGAEAVWDDPDRPMLQADDD